MNAWLIFLLFCFIIVGLVTIHKLFKRIAYLRVKRQMELLKPEPVDTTGWTRKQKRALKKGR